MTLHSETVKDCLTRGRQHKEHKSFQRGGGGGLEMIRSSEKRTPGPTHLQGVGKDNQYKLRTEGLGPVWRGQVIFLVSRLCCQLWWSHKDHHHHTRVTSSNNNGKLRNLGKLFVSHLQGFLTTRWERNQSLSTSSTTTTTATTLIIVRSKLPGIHTLALSNDYVEGFEVARPLEACVG